jgi:hypothetical protein
MIRYQCWFFTLVLLLISLSSIACSGNPENSTPTINSGPPVYEGFHDGLNCHNLGGWAWDANRPNEPVKVEIYDGSNLLATTTADTFRQDLLTARIGNGLHGFNFALPNQLRDGKPHTIRVKIAGADKDLSLTSKQITCKPE